MKLNELKGMTRRTEYLVVGEACRAIPKLYLSMQSKAYTNSSYSNLEFSVLPRENLE